MSQNWTEMDHPALQLSIFLILAITDTSNAVYNRYVAKVDTRVSSSDDHWHSDVERNAEFYYEHLLAYSSV